MPKLYFKMARLLHSIFSFKKASLKEEECNWGSGACVSDFKFALQTDLTLLITCLFYLTLILPWLCSQPVPAWTTFRVGLFCGLFIALNVTVILSGRYPAVPQFGCILLT